MGFKNVVIEGDAWNVIEPLRNQVCGGGYFVFS